MGNGAEILLAGIENLEMRNEIILLSSYFLNLALTIIRNEKEKLENRYSTLTKLTFTLHKTARLCAVDLLQTPRTTS